MQLRIIAEFFACETLSMLNPQLSPTSLVELLQELARESPRGY